MNGELDSEAERALLARCAAGDDGAWDELYRRYAPRVHRFVARVASPGADREDLVQRVFMALVTSLPSYRGEARLGTWLYRLTANIVSKDARHEGRRRRRDDAWQRSWEVVAGDGGWSPERVASAREQLDCVGRALDTLSVEQRMVWVMREVEGLEVDEVARALGCTRLAVRARHHRARKRVFEAVQDSVLPEDERSLGPTWGDATPSEEHS